MTHPPFDCPAYDYAGMCKHVYPESAKKKDLSILLDFIDGTDPLNFTKEQEEAIKRTSIFLRELLATVE